MDKGRRWYIVRHEFYRFLTITVNHEIFRNSPATQQELGRIRYGYDPCLKNSAVVRKSGIKTLEENIAPRLILQLGAVSIYSIGAFFVSRPVVANQNFKTFISAKLSIFTCLCFLRIAAGPSSISSPTMFKNRDSSAHCPVDSSPAKRGRYVPISQKFTNEY